MTYAVEFRGPKDMSVVLEKEHDHGDRDPLVHEFLQESQVPKIKNQSPDFKVSVDSPLICFQIRDSSANVFMGQLFFNPAQEKKDAFNLMRLEFPHPVIAFSSYPTSRVVKKTVRVRSTCSYGFLTVNEEKKEARIFGQKLWQPLQGSSFNKLSMWKMGSTQLCDQAYQLLERFIDQSPKSAIFNRSASYGRFAILRYEESLILVGDKTAREIFTNSSS